MLGWLLRTEALVVVWTAFCLFDRPLMRRLLAILLLLAKLDLLLPFMNWSPGMLLLTLLQDLLHIWISLLFDFPLTLHDRPGCLLRLLLHPVSVVALFMSVMPCLLLAKLTRVLCLKQDPVALAANSRSVLDFAHDLPLPLML